MPDDIKIDLFHPPQPRIPGVSDAETRLRYDSTEEAPEPSLPSPALERLRSLVPLLWFMLTMAGIVTAGAGLLLWSKKVPEKTPIVSQPSCDNSRCSRLTAKEYRGLTCRAGAYRHNRRTCETVVLQRIFISQSRDQRTGSCGGCTPAGRSVVGAFVAPAVRRMQSRIRDKLSEASDRLPRALRSSHDGRSV